MHTQDSSNEGEWISLEEAADLCRVSINTMREWMRLEIVPYRRGVQGRYQGQVHRPSLYERLQTPAPRSRG